MADSAGVRVSALKAEIETENAMVSANCRKRIPVVPGKSATGTNTATRTSEVATTAPATSFIATEAAVVRFGDALDDVPLHILNHHDGVVHHQPVASVIPNSVSVFDRETQQFHENECPDQRNGNGNRGDERAPPIRKNT